MILVCNLHINAGILHYFFPILWVTSQYYFVLQSLHKALPSITLYYKACTKHVPVILCTTRLTESISQYYFVLPSLPALLCTTKLAQSTSQYYFVLQNLHKARPSTTLYYKACTKALPSTTLYYKACTKQVPILLCTTKFAQSTFQDYFVLRSLRKYVAVLLCTANLAHSTSQYYFVLQCLHKESFYTQQVLSQRDFYTQQTF